MTKPKMIVVAPYAGIWQHSLPEAIAASGIQLNDFDVVYLGCNRDMDKYCLTMSALGLKEESSAEEKKMVCDVCTQRKSLLKKHFSLAGPDISAFLDSAILTQIQNILNNVTRANYLQLSLFDVPVGKKSLYEFLLHRKKSNLELSEKEWSDYLISLENCLKMLFAFRALVEVEKPQVVMFYNSLYSTHSVCCEYAEKNGIAAYSMNGSPNLAHQKTEFIFQRGNNFDFLQNLKLGWKNYKDKALLHHEVSKATDHFFQLFLAKSVFAYSAPKSLVQKDLRAFFKIRPEQKIVLAAMSSYDEMFSTVTVGSREVPADTVFSDQVLWIKSLAEYARTRPDVFIIVRVHPREFPNRRENLKSMHAAMLEKEFENLPSNVAINWPTQNLSLYDLAEITDAVGVAWSSVGKELSLFGIPCVVFSADALLYPAELNYHATTEADYHSKLDEALRAGWSFERIRTMYRWYVHEMVRPYVDISDGYHPAPPASSGLVPRIFRKAMRTLDPVFAERLDVRRQHASVKGGKQMAEIMRRGKANILDISEVPQRQKSVIDGETETVRTELKRLTDVMYAGLGDTPVVKGSLRERLLRAAGG